MSISSDKMQRKGVKDVTCRGISRSAFSSLFLRNYMTHSCVHKNDTCESNQNHHSPACNYPFEQICVERHYLAFLRHFFPRPVIEHVTDHYTADAAVDKAAFIILSPLTDKQAFSTETCRRA